ncbi:Zn-finger protein [Anaerotaenia torta]|uniref:cysteine-rich small domain-containing protein n=1 Tax=Anaerotaenia torta TaxID=433293 RepID=UPI003D217FA6
MENSYRFFANRDCQYYPCHKGIQELNCLFCYCPFYTWERCPGKPVYKEREGGRLKVCAGCDFPHHPENYDKIIQYLKAGTVPEERHT